LTTEQAYRSPPQQVPRWYAELENPAHKARTAPGARGPNFAKEHALGAEEHALQRPNTVMMFGESLLNFLESQIYLTRLPQYAKILYIGFEQVYCT